MRRPLVVRAYGEWRPTQQMEPLLGCPVPVPRLEPQQPEATPAT